MAVAGRFSQKLFRLSLLKNVRVLQKAYASSFGDSTKRGMPGAYPKTEEERIAAAKKYNIRVEDYEPYPDDGLGWGDYPKMEKIHQDSRDPHADWDFPEERRNYGELLHIEEDFLKRYTPNSTKKYKYSHTQQAGMFFAVLGTLGFLFWLGSFYKFFPPVVPKQYPENNRIIPEFKMF
ncbi:NADH dehydrogenase [ubiquinone] 1 beta subcomplex subunit 8, mitochondrial-like [Anneissia japonica]|uniref:NADH dehydrogenase [ubiquinone] 1 beta subcomplex subunit 8, mitochondrial-like n=1 Tax=Anneissia japonica TaxID=1529436 RepID=UPI00142581EF|nr:NADH dehydrogenase [ubiquinone] 1 beta subcomplex subunit 8, mitochondrial-like [Anneissia japonica]